MKKEKSTIFEFGKALILMGFLVLTGMFFINISQWYYFIIPFILLLEGLFIIVHKIDNDFKSIPWIGLKFLAILLAVVGGLISFVLSKILQLLNKSNITTILIVLGAIVILFVFCWLNNILHKKINEDGMF